MTTLLLLPELFLQDLATVDGDTHHHLFRVKRLQVGDELRVVDGLGNARLARIESIGKREARIALAAAAPANEPATRVELYVAVPKPERAAWLVEKATELGVHSISFISTDREARALAPAQRERLRRIAISALEQCGRSWLPPIEDAGELRAAVSRAREGAGSIVVLDGSGARSRPAVDQGGRVAPFVGPEGGWSATERSWLEEESCPLWALGPTVLRVETAAIAAVATLLTPRG